MLYRGHFSSRPPIQRMQWLDERLRSEAFPTASEATQRFEISRRTFYRDIDYMRVMLGAPIAYDRQRRGYHYTDKTFSLAAVTLSEGELLALLVAEHLLTQYEGTPFGPSLAHAIEKIAGSLTEPVTVDLSVRSFQMLFDLGPIRPPNVRVFNAVAASLRERRALNIRYYTQSRDVESERLVEPYHLHNYKGDWYLVAFCHKRRQVRSFLVSRIRSASPTARPYAIPPTSTLARTFARALASRRAARASMSASGLTPTRPPGFASATGTPRNAFRNTRMGR